MKVTFIGTSHGIAEKDRFCSCTVVTVNGKHYVIDAGAPIYDLLQRYDFRFEDVAGIFITHSHSDHMIGLVALYDALNTFNEFSHIKINAFTPDIEKYNKIKEFFNYYEDFNRLTFNKYENGLFFDDGNVKITSIPTKHFEGSHSFILEAEGKKIAFTGDLCADLNDYPTEFTTTDTPFELVVMESAHQWYSENYVVEILKETKTKRMAINHIYPLRNTPEILTAFANKMKNYLPVILSYDGMVIEL